MTKATFEGCDAIDQIDRPVMLDGTVYYVHDAQPSENRVILNPLPKDTLKAINAWIEAGMAMVDVWGNTDDALPLPEGLLPPMSFDEYFVALSAHYNDATVVADLVNCLPLCIHCNEWLEESEYEAPGECHNPRCFLNRA